MKKISLFLILSYLFCSSDLSFANEERLLQQQKKKKEVIIKSTTGVPVFRSPNNSPIQVFVYSGILIICFNEALKDVLISVVNVDTNEDIMEKAYDAQKGNIVEVILNGRGKYQINLNSTIYEGYGSFTVDEL